VDSNRLKERIRENAAEIVRLHSRIHETLADRAKSPEKRLKWEQACAEFHSRYDRLAFPGGYAGALGRISSGDTGTIEAAICFLECRPYFFRSGYMFKDILRRCRRAPLSKEQAERLGAIEEKLAAWRQRRQAKNQAKKTREAKFKAQNRKGGVKPGSDHERRGAYGDDDW
jgi:hypothetical protein